MGFKTWDDQDDEEAIVILEITSTLMKGRGTIPSTRTGNAVRAGSPTDYSEEERAWRVHALCLGLDDDIFHPERGESMLPAYAICQACSVRIECLEGAITSGDNMGIRGGHTPEERKKIRVKVRQGASYEEASKPLDESRYKKFLKSRVRQQMLRQNSRQSA